MGRQRLRAGPRARLRRRDTTRHLDLTVVNYRTPQDLDRFVESVIAHADDLDITLVVANVAPGADDLAAGAAAVARSRPRVRVVHLAFEDNVGYGRACNAGAALGSAEVLGVFNADTQVTDGVLGACHDALVAHPRWGPLGPRQVDHEGRITAGGTFGTPEHPRIRGFREPDTGQCSDVRDDAVTVAGSAYFVRRQVWQELTRCPTFRSVAPDALGAFLPTPLFYEETFCSYHAAAHGYHNVYYGTVSMIHSWHRSIHATDAPAAALFERSRAMFRTACDAHGIPHD